jgi:hypothetical protein
MKNDWISVHDKLPDHRQKYYFVLKMEVQKVVGINILQLFMLEIFIENRRQKQLFE